MYSSEAQQKQEIKCILLLGRTISAGSKPAVGSEKPGYPPGTAANPGGTFAAALSILQAHWQRVYVARQCNHFVTE